MNTTFVTKLQVLSFTSIVSGLIIVSFHNNQVSEADQGFICINKEGGGGGGVAKLKKNDGYRSLNT